MEVDLNPSSSPIDSRHSSPFVLSFPGSTSSTPSSSSANVNAKREKPDRKRRRSGQSFSGPLSPSHDDNDREGGSGEAYMADHEGLEMQGAPAKRRQLDQADIASATTHHYRSLGSAYENSLASFETDNNDYGVDSPIHFLSLASPSPPAEIDGRLMQNDIDMSDSCNATLQNDCRSSSSSFVPRQVKLTQSTRSILASTVPLRPSPLIHSQRFYSSSSNTHSKGSNLPSSQSSSSEDSPNKKGHPTTVNQDQLTDSPSSSCTSSPRQGHNPLPPNSDRNTDRLLGLARTPSPSPLSMSTEADSRKLHHSPGLNQSAFPGGKQMLRYTMGYREDCSSCKNKTPGHYGHVMHR